MKPYYVSLLWSDTDTIEVERERIVFVTATVEYPWIILSIASSLRYSKVPLNRRVGRGI